LHTSQTAWIGDSIGAYLRAEDQRHEVPPPVFGSEDRQRRTPYIYSREDVSASSKPRLVWGDTLIRSIAVHYTTFFGLLACTGMRLSEAINLRCRISPRMVLSFDILNSAKSRLLPLHATTQAALERYLPKRRVFAPFDDHVFVACENTSLFRPRRLSCFSQNYRTIGLPRHPGLPRPHDPCNCDTHLP